MLAFESSIIIPAFDTWEQTRKCLKAIAETTDTAKVEVLVVGAASSAITERVYTAFGKQCFGDSFRYIRNTEKKTFARACNQGATLAKGEFLIFLHNNTEVQPNWYQPLLDDFVQYDNIAATAPIFVYPEETVLGRIVDNLGIYINYYNIDNLYKGIPYASPLARKRRFFQVISATCFVITKKLFVDIGKFDENFINGFEDVDLCLRLSEKGYRMTVNPDSLVIHHGGQSQNRQDYTYCLKKNSNRLKEDYRHYVCSDSFQVKVSKWLTLYPSMPEETIAHLNTLLPSMHFDELVESYIENPYWENGLYEILRRSVDDRQRIELFTIYTELFPEPSNTIKLTHLPWVESDPKLLSECVKKLSVFFVSPFSYLRACLNEVKRCASQGLKDLAEQFAALSSEFTDFCSKEFSDFARALWRIECLLGLRQEPDTIDDYLLWRYAVDNDVRKNELASFVRDFKKNPEDFPAISIVMPLSNPKSEHLREAIDSVLAQSYPFWELCLAHDTKTAPKTQKILSHYTKKDNRIRVKTGDTHGKNAAATNIALSMATHPWVALMDQDALLTDDALAFVAKAIGDNPNATLFFSDEDTFDGMNFSDPSFKKNTWDWELLPVLNCAPHLVTYRTDRLRAIDGLRDEFEGAAEYDLLLRSLGNGEEEKSIHIPHVLYHRRKAEESSSSDARAVQRAGQAWLDKYAPGSRIESVPDNQPMHRLVYTLSSPQPSVSLLCPLPASNFPVASYDTLWRTKTAGSLEMIYVCKEEDIEKIRGNLPPDFTQRSRITVVPNAFSPIQMLQGGVKEASGDILGFIDFNLIPQNETWLKEITACLWREPIGVVAGKITAQDGTLIHGGYETDAGGGLKKLFAERENSRSTWFGWTKRARTVEAVDRICLFTKKADFVAFDGFDTSLGDWGAQDYCLRLGEKGKRTVWWPYAEFVHLNPSLCVMPIGVESFSKKCCGRMASTHANLLSLGFTWNLYDRNAPQFDFSSDEYLRLYPDLAYLKTQYVNHYLTKGIKEGRKGRLSHIDYTHMTQDRIAAWKKTAKNGIIVCTSLCGDYERLLPPAFINDGWRYICYSDKPRESWGIWEIRPIPYENDNLTRRSRWAKLNLPFLFPEAQWVFWLDANIVIGNDLSPLLHGKKGALFMTRHGMRTCIYEEGSICAKAGKESQEAIERQLQAYKKAGMPVNFGLWENNFFLLNPKAKEVKILFAQWWEEYCQYSKRDQISLPYVFYRNNYKPQILFPDGRNVHSWPALYVLTHEETNLIDIPKKHCLLN